MNFRLRGLNDTSAEMLIVETGLVSTVNQDVGVSSS